MSAWEGLVQGRQTSEQVLRVAISPRSSSRTVLTSSWGILPGFCRIEDMRNYYRKSGNAAVNMSDLQRTVIISCDFFNLSQDAGRQYTAGLPAGPRMLKCLSTGPAARLEPMFGGSIHCTGHTPVSVDQLVPFNESLSGCGSSPSASDTFFSAFFSRLSKYHTSPVTPSVAKLTHIIATIPL